MKLTSKGTGHNEVEMYKNTAWGTPGVVSFNREFWEGVREWEHAFGWLAGGKIRVRNATRVCRVFCTTQ